MNHTDHTDYDALFADRDPDYDAAERVRSAVHHLMIARHGRDALTLQPRFPGPDSPDAVPADMRQGIAAAVRVRTLADELMRRYTIAARGQGMSWAELAVPMGLQELPDPALAAFDRVARFAGPELGYSCCYWRCNCCAEWVIDRGPCAGDSAVGEAGHRTDCARHGEGVDV